MRIGILTSVQSVKAFLLGRERPKRSVGKVAAKTLLRRRLCSTVRDPDTGEILKSVIREVGIGAARMADNDPLRYSRVDLNDCVSYDAVADGGKLNPPGQPETLLLQYPLEDQSSFRRENRRRIWSLKRYLGPRVWDENILCDQGAEQCRSNT